MTSMRIALAMFSALAGLAACSGSPHRAANPTSKAPTAAAPTGATTSASPSSPVGLDAMPAASSFSATVTNPWFPLTPGKTYVYQGTKDEEPAIDKVTVSTETQVVHGVRCRVVLDRLYLSGKLAETTRDYYSQDAEGNVWYFGEDTAEINPDGTMASTEGTWRAGEAGALPGIFITASPRIGDAHRQEYYAGHAEDFFKAINLNAAIKVPYRSFTGALLTEEWTPLEPDVLDHKYYVRGIGTVKEVSVKGPLEELSLVSVS